ncbi:Quinolinate phosphoribosyl transferase [Pavlovales sp. CCMP2436]|nr:Quinolinate phosphoribosyl transferase [Pavlovales sp. CCMP2436]
MEADCFEDLLPPEWKAVVHGWLREDTPAFDVGGFVVGNKPEVAHLYAKSPGMLCGVPFVNAVFEACGCEVEWLASEGSMIDLSGEKKLHVATVRGPARKLLLGERTALNTLSRASGVATRAATAVRNARAAGWMGAVAGTRKTTPGFRLVEKYALLVAGADTHRYDLSHMVMLKDNHIWSAGSITHAVAKARRAAGFSTKIEVEAGTLEEGLEAAAAGADIVMLDNFEPAALKVAAAQLKRAHPHVLIEASGGITVENLTEFASADVDIISKSYHQGYDVLDFSLKIMPGAK